MTMLVLRALAWPWPGRSRAPRLLERNVIYYRRFWLVIVSGFFEPILYLLSIGLGVGALVGTVPGPAGQPISYALFVAPALMATAAMNGALYDATFNFFFKLKYGKLYDTVLVTPLEVGDVAVGEVAWALFRGTFYAVAFVVTMVALGLAGSPLVVLAVPGAMLIGFATASLGIAATSFMRRWTDFDLIAVVTMPLFLFSGTFFPISVYPGPLQAIVQLSPLYHGVDLLRGLALGHVGPEALVHIAYLVALGLLGLVITSRRLRRLLLK